MSEVVEADNEFCADKTKNDYNLERSKKDCSKSHEKKEVKNRKGQSFDKVKQETIAKFADAKVDKSAEDKTVEEKLKITNKDSGMSEYKKDSFDNQLNGISTNEHKTQILLQIEAYKIILRMGHYDNELEKSILESLEKKKEILMKMKAQEKDSAEEKGKHYDTNFRTRRNKSKTKQEGM